MTKQIVFLGLIFLTCIATGTIYSQVPFQNHEGKYGYGSNEEKYPDTYPFDCASYFNSFDQGLVKQNGKWSLIDNKYKIVAGEWDSVDIPRFESLESREQIIYVMVGNKWKIYQPKSKKYSTEFDSICTGFTNVFSYTEEIQPLWADGKIKLLCKKTNIISPAYDGIYFDNSNAYDFTPEVNYFMKLNGKVVVTDANGVAQNTYDYMDTIQPVWDSFYAVKNNGTWNFVTRKGKLALKKWIPDSNFFNTRENVFAFIKQKGKKYSIDLYTWDINELNSYKDYEETYDEIYGALPISDNPGAVALVKREKYGFVDKDLNIRIPFEYENGYDFNSGLAFVKKDGLWGGINEAGITIIPFQYNDCKNYGSEYIVEKNGKYGLLNFSGNELIPLEYEDMDFTTSNGIYTAKGSGNWGLITY